MHAQSYRVTLTGNKRPHMRIGIWHGHASHGVFRAESQQKHTGVSQVDDAPWTRLCRLDKWCELLARCVWNGDELVAIERVDDVARRLGCRPAATHQIEALCGRARRQVQRVGGCLVVVATMIKQQGESIHDGQHAGLALEDVRVLFGIRMGGTPHGHPAPFAITRWLF